jgi:hypothetical protein
VEPTTVRLVQRVFATDMSTCVGLSADEWARRGIHRTLTELVLAPRRPLL